jgi:hypothetical protein
MATHKPEEYVSIIGMSYLHPISNLLETLDSFNPGGPNELQASSLENGYSASIIILTALLVESAISRTQYIRGDNAPQKPVKFVRVVYPDSGFAETIEELFVVRDVIAHSHLWEAQFQWDEISGIKLVSTPLLRDGYGDEKFRRVIDVSSRTTRKLGVNVFPTRISRTDAVIILKTAVDFLLFLENEDRRYIYISPQCVKFGETISHS